MPPDAPAPASNGTTSTVVATSAQVSPQPVPSAAPPAARTPTTKTYQTGSAVQKGSVAGKNSGTSTRPTTAAQSPVTPAATSKAPVTDIVAKTAPAATEAAPVVAATTDAAATVETPKPTETPAQKTLTAADEARRLAQISRAEGKAAQEKQRVAEERRALETERAANTQNLQRLKLIEDASKLPKGQRLAFLQRAFGWRAADLIEDVIGEQAKTPEQVAAETSASQMMTLEERTKEINRRVEEFEKATTTQREQAQISDYIRTTIEPAITPEKYPFLCNELGSQAARQVYDAMNAEYKKTGTAPDLKKLVDTAETWYRKDAEKKAKLLGLSVTAQQAATQTATPASPASTATTQSLSATSSRRRVKEEPRPYQSTVRR